MYAGVGPKRDMQRQGLRHAGTGDLQDRDCRGKIYCRMFSSFSRDFLFSQCLATDTVTRGESVVYAEFNLKPYDRFVRAEVMDAEGRKAWSSAYTVRREDLL